MSNRYPYPTVDVTIQTMRQIWLIRPDIGKLFCANNEVDNFGTDLGPWCPNNDPSHAGDATIAKVLTAWWTGGRPGAVVAGGGDNPALYGNSMAQWAADQLGVLDASIPLSAPGTPAPPAVPAEPVQSVDTLQGRSSYPQQPSAGQYVVPLSSNPFIIVGTVLVLVILFRGSEQDSRRVFVPSSPPGVSAGGGTRRFAGRR